jgi:hypothetical protein
MNRQRRSLFTQAVIAASVAAILKAFRQYKE